MMDFAESSGRGSVGGVDIEAVSVLPVLIESDAVAVCAVAVCAVAGAIGVEVKVSASWRLVSAGVLAMVLLGMESLGLGYIEVSVVEVVSVRERGPLPVADA